MTNDEKTTGFSQVVGFKAWKNDEYIWASFYRQWETLNNLNKRVIFRKSIGSQLWESLLRTKKMRDGWDSWEDTIAPWGFWKEAGEW